MARIVLTEVKGQTNATNGRTSQPGVHLIEIKKKRHGADNDFH